MTNSWVDELLLFFSFFIAKCFDNFFIGPIQTYMDYKLDPLFTPTWFPFPSLSQEIRGRRKP